MYMYVQPGKKLLFMGGEIAQFIEWNEWKELDWHLLEFDKHLRMQGFVSELNKFYQKESCLFEEDTSFKGFNWIEHDNADESIIAFERINSAGEKLICVFNFTPIARNNYPLGVDEAGKYKTLMTSDHQRFGGTTPRIKTYTANDEKHHNRDFTIRVDLPPLGGMYLKIK